MRVTLFHNSLLYHFQSLGEIKKEKTNISISSLRNNENGRNLLVQQNKMLSLWLLGEEKLKDFAKLNWDLPREESREI